MFDPPPSPISTPKSRPWGMTQATELKIPSNMFYIFREKTHTVWFKIFKIECLMEI